MGKNNQISWRKSRQNCRKDVGLSLLAALEAESLVSVCYSFLLGTWGLDTKEKGGKEEGKAGGVSRCTSKSWKRHR